MATVSLKPNGYCHRVTSFTNCNRSERRGSSTHPCSPQTVFSTRKNLPFVTTSRHGTAHTRQRKDRESFTPRSSPEFSVKQEQKRGKAGKAESVEGDGMVRGGRGLNRERGGAAVTDNACIHAWAGGTSAKKYPRGLGNSGGAPVRHQPSRPRHPLQQSYKAHYLFNALSVQCARHATRNVRTLIPTLQTRLDEERECAPHLAERPRLRGGGGIISSRPAPPKCPRGVRQRARKKGRRATNTTRPSPPKRSPRERLTAFTEQASPEGQVFQVSRSTIHSIVVAGQLPPGGRETRGGGHVTCKGHINT